MPDQKTMRTRCLGGFSVMWVTKLLISPVKKGFFAQKWPNLTQNWHFWSIWVRPCRLIRCPVGGSVGGCGAGCISQDTFLLYISFIPALVLSLDNHSMCRGSKDGGNDKRWICKHFSIHSIIRTFWRKENLLSTLISWFGTLRAFLQRSEK